jgi:hypothetical protein
LLCPFVQNQHYKNFLCSGQQKNNMENIIWHKTVHRQQTFKLMELSEELLATNYMHNNRLTPSFCKH